MFSLNVDCKVFRGVRLNLTFCTRLKMSSQKSFNSGTAGAGSVVLYPKFSFLSRSEGFKKKNTFQLRLDTKVAVLTINSDRYSLLEGIGMFFNEKSKLTRSMFRTRTVLKGKSNTSRLNRGRKIDLIGVFHKTVLHAESLTQENSQVIYFEVGRTNLFHVLTTSLTKSSATITDTNITHKFTFYIPK